MKMTFNTDPQGSDGWHESRRGRITGSKFKDARDKSDGMTDQQRAYVSAVKSGKSQVDAMVIAGYKAAPRAEVVTNALSGNVAFIYSAAATLYARNVARERFGGKAEGVFVNKAMQFGNEQEPLARAAYETTTGYFVDEVGFAASDCGMFGLSPDGLIGDDGVLEIKTMVGSDNLFDTVIEKDYSAYMDQCLGYLLFLGREWVDLALWTPDLEHTGLGLVIHRINRSEHLAEIAALDADLKEFSFMVRKLESELRSKAAENIDLLRMAA